MPELFGLRPRDPEHAAARYEGLFNFVLRSTSPSIYYFTDDAGLRTGPVQAGEVVRFVFLINAAQDKTVSYTDDWTCNAFFLDAEPIERPVRPRHFQLVHEPHSDGVDFCDWAATVIRYLSGFHLGAMLPALDCHDLATVLESVTRPRLKFSLITPVDELEVVSILSVVPDYRNVLALYYCPVGRFCPLGELEQIYSIDPQAGGWFKFGGGIHPNPECALMVLGEPRHDG